MFRFFDKYQEEVQRTQQVHKAKKDALCDYSMGLSGEAGEVTDCIKKIVWHSWDICVDKLREEIGDVLWYIAALCNTLGLSMSDVAEVNVNKLRKRYPEGFSTHKSKNRKEKALLAGGLNEKPNFNPPPQKPIKHVWELDPLLGAVDDVSAATDIIDHPTHYNQGKIEVWDFVQDQQLGFCSGNIIKYICRAPHKNGLEDYKKAKKYIERLILEEEKKRK